MFPSTLIQIQRLVRPWEEEGPTMPWLLYQLRLLDATYRFVYFQLPSASVIHICVVHHLCHICHTLQPCHTNHAMPYQLALLAASYKLMCMIIKSTRYLYLSSSKHDVAALLPAYVSKCFHTHVIICHFQIPVFIWDVQLHLAISPLTFIVTIIV